MASFRTAQRTCRGCGRVEPRAHGGGCSWVLLDIESPSGICSVCAAEMKWDPELMAHFINPWMVEEEDATNHPLLRSVGA